MTQALTERLYQSDSFLRRFSARVRGHSEVQGKSALRLDRSGFYPESGGQLADHGTIGGLQIDDVQVVGGDVLHVVASSDVALPPVGSEVEADIDWPRRRLHMALHSGQHVLSRALLDRARARTVSSRLGESVCTIDVDRPELSSEELDRVEELANSIIDDDRPLRAYFPSAAELQQLELRRAPKVEGNIRVVEIEGFDVTPCGGTHVARSAQIGEVWVSGVERYKKGTRVSFAAGRRARLALRAESRTLRDLAQHFSCGLGDVPAAVNKLRRELKDARETLGELRAQAAERWAEQLCEQLEASGRQHAVANLEGAPVELLRKVSALVAERPQTVAVIGGSSNVGTHVVVTRAADSTQHAGQLMQRLAKLCGGRGGGRPERAEGRLPAGVDLAALVEQALVSDG